MGEAEKDRIGPGKMSGPCVISIFNHLASSQAANFISKHTMLLHAQVVPLHTLLSRPGIPCPPFELVSTEHPTTITAVYNRRPERALGWP